MKELVDSVEHIKDWVHDRKEMVLDAEDIRALQAKLSAIRTVASQLDRHVQECQLRQNVYAEICEKMLDRLQKHGK